MLHKDYDHKGSAEKKIARSDPQGTWCQDELNGSKRPVAKKLWLWQSVSQSFSQLWFGNKQWQFVAGYEESLLSAAAT
jgi:hypothetical protein